MDQSRTRVVNPRSRPGALTVALCLLTVCVSGCAALGYSNRVLWRVVSPSGELVAICQEVPAFDGPGYDVRLERPGGGLVRHLYDIGDGDPCSEVVWSPDGQTLAVVSGHVARVRFVDVGWALANPDVPTAYWSWRQVDLSTQHTHLEGSTLRFVSPASVEIDVCPARSRSVTERCGDDSSIRRVDIPQPIVTGHR